ncbi:ABC transporter substrate-binding protein [Tistrella mobilis]
MSLRRAMTGAVLALLVLAASADAAEGPMRVVSINLCTDQLLLRLGDPAQIAAIGPLSRDPKLSVEAARAATVPQVAASAETVHALEPDLVLAGRFGATAAAAALERLGTRVERFRPAASVDMIRDGLLRAGRLLGPAASARAEAEVARLEARAADLAARAATLPRRPRALMLRADGSMVGPGGLAHAMLVTGGFDNILEHRFDPAGRARRGGDWRVELEAAIRARPEAILIESMPGAAPALVHRLPRHPALARLAALGDMAPEMIRVPGNLLVCGLPDALDIAEALLPVARRLSARPAIATEGDAS